jgi:hypothetical protein
MGGFERFEPFKSIVEVSSVLLENTIRLLGYYHRRCCGWFRGYASTMSISSENECIEKLGGALPGYSFGYPDDVFQRWAGLYGLSSLTPKSFSEFTPFPPRYWTWRRCTKR